MKKLDTMYRPQRTRVGYRLDTRAMIVGLLQYKRDETVEVIEPWLTTPSFTLLQGAVLCGKLKNASNCNRWIRPYFFSVQNTICAALTTKWKKIQGYYTGMGIAKVKAKYGLPKNLERRLLPLIACPSAVAFQGYFRHPGGSEARLGSHSRLASRPNGKIGALRGTLDSTQPNLCLCG
jgi:hypothetical protein